MTETVNGKTTGLTDSQWDTLRSVGRLYRATGGAVSRKRLEALIREAQGTGGTIHDISAAALLSPSTIRRYLKN